MEKNITNDQMNEMNQEILVSVERGLGILGESAKQAILWYISKAGIPREEIPLELNRVVAVLGEMFGSGAVLLQNEIEQNIRMIQRRSVADAYHVANAISELKRGGSNGRANLGLSRHGLRIPDWGDRGGFRTAGDQAHQN